MTSAVKIRTLLSSFEDRLTNLEGNIPPLSQQIKDVGGEITRVTAMLGRMDRFDEALLQQRIEVKQNYEELDRQSKKREEEAEKVRRLELRGLEANIVELRKDISVVPELKRAIQARADETIRLEKEINEARVRIRILPAQRGRIHSRLSPVGRRTQARC